MRLRAWVHVADEKGQMHAFGPGSVVPGWARERITNPAAWEDGEAAATAAEPVTSQARTDAAVEQVAGDGGEAAPTPRRRRGVR